METKQTATDPAFLLEQLYLRFPEIVLDEPLSGADAVERLSQWWEELTLQMDRSGGRRDD